MLTEQKIRTFAGEQNFLKGQQGVRDGAIVNPEQQAMTLKAYCYGSLPEPFRVQVTFDGSGITASLCSCYQVACSYLAKIRSLYEKLDETEQWTTYIAWLRKRHSRLSTLKEELASVGL